jgi:Putative Actinobacterial Holin-X, holin superfamily III
MIVEAATNADCPSLRDAQTAAGCKPADRLMFGALALSSRLPRGRDIASTRSPMAERADHRGYGAAAGHDSPRHHLEAFMSSDSTEERQDAIAQLFRELSAETSALVREEVRLLRDDLTREARRAGASAGMLGGAGLLGLGAFGAVTAMLVQALGRGRPGRGAFLVASLYGAGAAALGLRARDQLREVAPEALHEVQADVKAAAEGVRTGT